MFELIKSELPGCQEVLTRKYEDYRGKFVKTFHGKLFDEMGLNIDWTEEYYSTSIKGVLRGMHFQLPPYDHEKLVYCVGGEVLDVVVDLRFGSPTFGEHTTFTLSAERANMVYIPKGMAHGFFVQSENAIMMYKVSTVYAPEHDSGILWNSVGISWPTKNPLISKRDTGFVTFAEFDSPFRF